MSKAIFILDEMPENCHECPVDCAAYFASDQVTFKTRLDGCPLCSMPEKVTETLDDGSFFDGCDHGWNDCIEAIEGSGEDA